ncbi:hypothetical protein EDD15DRAFT_2292689 [Pisolithus albus]|nr:hypothetical protein EDD15DRAFT_2292689 [Pisolithus albus]
MFFARCRLSLSRTVPSASLSTGSWLEASQVYFQRFRSSSPRKKTSHDKSRSLKLSHYDTTRQRSRPDFSRPRRMTFGGKKPHELDDVAVSNANDAILAIETKVDQWALLPHVQRRMLSFGIPRKDLAELLGSFLDDVRDGMLSNEQRLAELGFGRFMSTSAEMSSGQHVDQVISQLFFMWASHPTIQNTLRKHIADLSFPADLFPVARSMRRKIIMHVGPTDSGEPLMSLRALAAAKSGLYAGPLCLLAHEMRERLNMG